MGVLKLANTGYKAVNNPTFKNVGVVKTTPTMADDVANLTSNVTSSLAFSLASKVLTRSVPALFVASTLYDVGSGLYDIYKNYTSDKKTEDNSNTKIKTDEGIVTPKSIPETILNQAVTKAKSDVENVKAKSESIKAEFTAFEGTTLPEHMANNTSALVSAINHLTETVAQGSTQMSINVMALSQTLSDFSMLMEYGIEQNLKIKAVELGADTLKFPDMLNIKTDFSDSFNDVLGLKKEEIPKQIEKADLQIDDLTYRKTDVALTDLDGEVVATVSPREAETKKNITLAKKTTDENNFQLDEEDLDTMDTYSSLPSLDGLYVHSNRAKQVEDILLNRV